MSLSDKYRKEAQAEQAAHVKRDDAILGILKILEDLPAAEQYKVMNRVCKTLSRPDETYILQTRTPD